MSLIRQLSITSVLLWLSACGTVVAPPSSAPTRLPAVVPTLSIIVDTRSPTPTAAPTHLTPSVVPQSGLSMPSPSATTDTALLPITTLDRVGPTLMEEFVGTSTVYQVMGATSIWQNGSVQSADQQSWYPFFVYADRAYDDAPAHLEAMTKEWYDYLATPPSASGYPTIGTLAWGPNPPESNSYVHTWKCPRSIGALTITGITGGAGFSGIIVFTSSSGQAGSFELGTGQWNFTS